MNPEQLRAECREMGQALRKEIAAVGETIDALARSLMGAFEERASKEDITRLEKAIAALTTLLTNKA